MSIQDVIKEFLEAAEIAWEEIDEKSCVAHIAGESKQRISIAFSVGTHYLTVQSFVARHPDENHEDVWRYLLDRNRRTYVASFCTDAHGDIYLHGQLPLHAVTHEEIDRVAGAIVATTEEVFNTILEMGFRSAIEKEWAWKKSSGIDASNLAAFEHFLTD